MDSVDNRRSDEDIGVPKSASRLVQRCLAQAYIHQKWESAYRNVDNEKFYEVAFDYIAAALDPPKDSVILDAGCGIAAHSVRLASRGFIVQAVDISPIVLKDAKTNITARGWDKRIRIQCADILSLPFRDETFAYVLCWGVLMHIPDLVKAIEELARVVRAGGVVVISEANMNSIQSRVMRTLRRILKREKGEVRMTPSGIESWSVTPTGVLVTRQANVAALIAQWEGKGFILRNHVSGQFTELYTRMSSKLIIKLIHMFNKFWFNRIKAPRMALGNIIMLEKQ